MFILLKLQRKIKHNIKKHGKEQLIFPLFLLCVDNEIEIEKELQQQQYNIT